MTLLEALALVRRHLVVCVGLVLLTAAAATALAWQQPHKTTTTLMFSISANDQVATPQVFDATGVASTFAETVAGWLKSPTLSDEISKIAGVTVNASGNPQARENFLVDVQYANPQDEDTVAKATKTVLDSEIAKYNKESKYKFTAVLHGESTATVSQSLIKAGVAGGVGGGLLALLWLLCAGYAAGRVAAVSRAEELLGVVAAVTYKSVRSNDTAYVEHVVKKLGKDALLLGADYEVAPLAHKLKLKCETGRLPHDADKMVKHAGHVAVVVRLDTTREKTLRHVRMLTEGNVVLVVEG